MGISVADLREPTAHCDAVIQCQPQQSQRQ
jgi:hypothetical protein